MKIGIVGAGQVGATAAYSMMMRRVGSGILLVDHNADLAVAQARDILDATPLPIRSGSARASLLILMARAWSCLLRGLTRSRGRPGWACCRVTPKSSQGSYRQCWRRRRPRFF